MVPKGIIAAAVTPMTQSEEIDYQGIVRLCRHFLDAGIGDIFCGGTTGESYALTEEEKVRSTQAWIEAAQGRANIYVGVGMPATRDVLRLIERMRGLPITAFSVVTPYFIAPTQEMLYAHYCEIADQSFVPVLIYNIPGRTGIHMQAETVARLAEHGNIVGIKDSSGNFANIQAYLDHTPRERFAVLAGSDNLILECLQKGGTGAIAATTNICPQILAALYQSFASGDLATAQAAQDRLIPLCGVLGPSVVPALLKKMTDAVCPVGPIRRPLTAPELTAEQLAVLGALG